MRIAILGAGRVGTSIGDALKAKGHAIIYGVREPGAPAGFLTKTVGGAISGADAIILTTPWTVAEALVCEHAPALAGKIVIDATNPLNTNATRLALGFDTSGAELRRTPTSSRHSTSPARAPQHGQAIRKVARPRSWPVLIVMGLARDVGFEAVDAGELRAARLLEPLGVLMMQLEETGGTGTDLAFVLGSRPQKQVEPCALMDMEAHDAG